MEIFFTIGIIFLILFLTASIWANVFLLRRLLSFSENVDSMLLSLSVFQKHLNRINNMSMYHGDEIIASLLEHSTEIAAEIGTFRNDYESNIMSDLENADTTA